MNQYIQKILAEDESILWTGRPQMTKLFDEDTKKHSILRIIVSAAVGLALLGGYFAMCANSGTELKPMIPVVIFVCSFFAISGIFTSFRALNKTTYYITNQNVILVRGSDKHFSLPLSMVDDTKVIRGDNGLDSLCIGSFACKTPKHKLRYAGIECRRKELKDSSFVYYPVFYNISDAKNVEQQLIKAVADEKSIGNAVN